MLQQYAKANSLSCLLSSNKTSEVYPEPFRMQSNVIFKVTYSEYISYVLSLQSAMGVKLMTDIRVLSDMATTGNPKLYNCFLKDMAFAIIKELYYAELCKKSASIILPASFNDNNVEVHRILEAYQFCEAAKTELVRLCNANGYILPKNISDRNAYLFKLAVVLYHMSKQSDVVKEMNLVYDLAEKVES